MAFGIHKPGQGYWVRVMTAVMLGVLALAAAGWLFGEGQKLAETFPKTRWTVTLADLGAQMPAPGDTVTVEQRTAAGEYRALAEGVVDRTDDAARVFLKSVRNIDEEVDTTKVTHLAVSQDGATRRLATGGLPQRGAAIEPFYIQGSMALVAIILGAFVTIWLVGAKPGPVEFLIATDMEMKKVNWSTRRDILRSTNVVIFVTFVLSVALFGIDFVFQAFFKAIGVLTQ